MSQKRKLRQSDNEVEEPVVAKKDKNELEDDLEQPKDINNKATYKEILEHLYKQKDNEDRPLWKMFDVLPSKGEFPVYFDFIKDPIDLRTIKKKIHTNQYKSIDELEVDILLVFKNAHAFNEPKSQISKDATALKKSYLAKRIELNKSLRNARKLKPRGVDSRTISGDSEQSDSEVTMKADNSAFQEELKAKKMDLDISSLSQNAPSPSDSKDDGMIGPTFEHNLFSVLYNTVVGYSDPNGKQLSVPFLRLPNKRLYPDYYEIAKKPLSLMKIRGKIKNSYYSEIGSLEKDINSVFENALAYQRFSATMHGEAAFLKQLTSEKSRELEKSPGYIGLKEVISKRGRPRAPKSEPSEDMSQTSVLKCSTPAPKKINKLRDGVSTPDFSESKLLKERLILLYNSVSDYKDSDGRSLATMFLELPDRSEYPDYYKVIPHPIDMEKIHEKIGNNEYASEDDFIHDFEILFQNARHYNEEGSEIYEDSVTLEKALKKKRRYVNHLADGKNASPVKARQSSPLPMIRKLQPVGQFSSKCQELLHQIRSYTDDSGRVLAAIFEKLPSRLEYPDYYLLIKRPIDLTYIASRVHKYPTIDDLEQDLLLLFNNACTYNDPDSQIYKDALTLLRVMTQKRSEMASEGDNDLPDVFALVQNLLRTLFTKVIDHRDEEGRCYSDSVLEVEVSSTQENNAENKRKPITLPIIGQLLKLGFYKRLDSLQNDIFEVLKEAKRKARSDSEMYEDACELLTYFILERDILTKDGQRMISPAMNTTGRMVQQEIDSEHKEKLAYEEGNNDSTDEESVSQKGRYRGARTFEVSPDESELSYDMSLTHGNVTYWIGGFVYVKPEDPSRPPNIISIEKIWTQKDGLQGIFGSWYFRPEATFHLASRKFMERELFLSNQNSYIMMSGVLGKCYVMNVKEYIKFKPQDFKDEDVFVCESRYNTNTKAFNKIRIHSHTAEQIPMISREEPLKIKRVASIFATTSQPEDKKDNLINENKVELSSCAGYEFPTEKSLEMDIPNPEEGFTYYERYMTDNGLWKIGDSVYVNTDEGYLLLSNIDKIWTDANGVAKFQGTSFILPEDTKHLPTQFFLEQECFESNIEDVNLVSLIVGKCAILNQRDYQFSRPTEVEEKDVYMCSGHYNEDDLKFRKNMKGFKKLGLPEHIKDEEYWFFDRPYHSRRRPSLWLTSTGSKALIREEDQIEKNAEVDKNAFTLMKKEHAASLMKENPEIPIDEISTKSLERWMALSDEEKEEFRERAKKQGLGNEFLFIFQCSWGTCDYQFEDLQDLMVHVMEGSHLSNDANSENHNCEWRSCHRIQKKMEPFPTHSRLVRHIREVHFKTSRKKIMASQKSKFYFPRHQACEESFKPVSESSERPSSRDSSIASSLSPSGHLKQNRHIQYGPGMMPNASANPIYPNPLHMQAGMFPPYRTPTPQAVMQQQIMQQQQHMMIQARGQMLPNQPQRSQIAPPNQHPQPAGPSLLSVDQQQMLITQVQRQQQQIQKLQQQVQQLVMQQQQQKQALEEKQEEQSPIFVSPPPNSQKLRHSEAYLRYIEGLRDNKSSLSSWSELADTQHPKVNKAPVHWVGNDHGFESATDALWALRDHMLRDAVALSNSLT